RTGSLRAERRNLNCERPPTPSSQRQTVKMAGLIAFERPLCPPQQAGEGKKNPPPRGGGSLGDVPRSDERHGDRRAGGVQARVGGIRHREGLAGERGRNGNERDGEGVATSVAGGEFVVGG